MKIIPIPMRLHKHHSKRKLINNLKIKVNKLIAKVKELEKMKNE